MPSPKDQGVPARPLRVLYKPPICADIFIMRAPPTADASVPISGRTDRREVSNCTVSVILPTFNEARNIPILVARLQEILAELDYEIIIVDDDSPDHTWEIAADLSRQFARVLSVRRVDERGLSSAVLTGMHVARGHALVVMDADLQHDETRNTGSHCPDPGW